MSGLKTGGEIREEIKAYILGVVHVDKEKIRNDSLVFKEGYIDSMGFMMLIAFIEDKFAIKTTDEDLIEENFESVDAITDFINRKLQHKICAG